MADTHYSWGNGWASAAPLMLIGCEMRPKGRERCVWDVGAISDIRVSVDIYLFDEELFLTEN